jgi:hypothetical protein
VELPQAAHTSRGWRIDEIVPHFRLGPLGGAYMAAIKPFRHLIVYPQ